MKKRVIAALMASVLAVSMLAGCGGGTSSSGSAEAAPEAEAAEDAGGAEAAAPSAQQ